VATHRRHVGAHGDEAKAAERPRAQGRIDPHSRDRRRKGNVDGRRGSRRARSERVAAVPRQSRGPARRRAKRPLNSGRAYVSNRPTRRGSCPPVSGLRRARPATIRFVATTEPTINDALASLLRKTRRAWDFAGIVRSENTGSFVGKERPDILIVEPNLPPIVIETEVLPAVTVEKEAKSRLGRRLRSSDDPIYSSLSVRLPVRLRRLAGCGKTSVSGSTTT
jgi:hypothetical protein